ncbi:hypothetical protein Syun_023826 [Stephania yunnanensis]|uniref:F-box domain-containing protein n=1 Tax=Stephania yunnanensis TaxID=152371 RepID=A0AAP0F9M5_9MAGN
MEDPPLKKSSEEVGIGSICDDAMQEILSRLPAKSFAYAACVCSCWSRVCARVLSRPKLVSALSVMHLRGRNDGRIAQVDRAIDKAIDKVLAEPIRPHFAIAFARHRDTLKMIHDRIRQRLGSGVTIIVNKTRRIIGANAVTDEVTEVKHIENDPLSIGIVLMVGYVPGLRVSVVPFANLPWEKPPLESAINQFVTDIKDFTASVSGCSSPVGIMVFMGKCVDAKLVLEKLDYAMSKDTAIVGDEDSLFFLYNNGAAKEKKEKGQMCGAFLVALVFAKEKESSHGEYQFSVALSTGISPVGPVYKDVRVLYRTLEANGPEWTTTTALTAIREGSVEMIGSQRMIHDLVNEDLYVGFVRQRKRCIGSEEAQWISYVALHKVNKADGDHLVVKGGGIKTGDQFQFYRPDPKFALMSRNNVLECFKALKLGGFSKLEIAKSNSGNRAAEIFGGLVFSCSGRGEAFFQWPDVDSSALTESFPGLPIGGMFCSSLIGRSTVAIQGAPVNCLQHVYCTAYLLMLYLPKLP